LNLEKEVVKNSICFSIYYLMDKNNSIHLNL